MALTQAGSELTERHRRSQVALRALVLRDVMRLYPALDLGALDRTWEPVLTALMALIEARRKDSAALAAGYYMGFRSAEGVTGTDFAPVRVAEIDVEQMARSLGFAGPAQAQRLLRVRPADARSQVLTSLSGTTSRLVLNAGRDTIDASVEADPKALGWARVTSSKPCSFCAMLAARGPVYSRGTVGFPAHDHCACVNEPVYRRDQPWPARSRELQSLWNKSTAGLSGREARQAFRQALEGA